MSLTIELSDRRCPICLTSDKTHESIAAAFDFSQLDKFAFASRKRPEYMHYRLVRCSACDLLYASPAPAAGALQQAYESASFDTSSESTFAAKTYADYLKSMAKELPDRSGALDIGTGDGTFLEQLIAAGFVDVQGVEPSAAPIRAAAPHVRPLIRNAPFRADEWTQGRFRLVTCFQTLEHVHDPLQLCKDVFRILKPGGAFFVVCHNRRALLNTVLGRKSPIYDIEHLQLFSRASVGALLRAAGFAKVNSRSIVNRYPISYWAKLLPIPQKSKDALLHTLRLSRVGGLTLPMPVGNLAAIAFR